MGELKRVRVPIRKINDAVNNLQQNHQAITYGDYLELRLAISKKNWQAVHSLCRKNNCQVKGDPDKFKTVIVEQLPRTGCESIW